MATRPVRPPHRQEATTGSFHSVTSVKKARLEQDVRSHVRIIVVQVQSHLETIEKLRSAGRSLRTKASTALRKKQPRQTDSNRGFLAPERSSNSA